MNYSVNELILIIKTLINILILFNNIFIAAFYTSLKEALFLLVTSHNFVAYHVKSTLNLLWTVTCSLYQKFYNLQSQKIISV